MHAALSIELANAGAAHDSPPLDSDFLKRFGEHQNKLRKKGEQNKVKAYAPLPVEPPVAAPPLEERLAVEHPPAAPPLEEHPAIENPPAPPAVDHPPAIEKDKIEEMESKALSDKTMDFWVLVRQTAEVDDLGPAQQAHFRRVEATGVGVCARC